MIELHSFGMFFILEQAQLPVLDGINLSVAVMLGSAIALPILQGRSKLPFADLIWLGAVVAISVSSLALVIGAHRILGRLRIRPAVLLRSPS
jgi:putative ABC transport system permease protein